MARILIVAEAGELFEFIEYNLTNEGHWVRLLHSPFLPKSTLNELSPDLLIADSSPKSHSAIEQLCQRIETNPRTRRCRILLVKPAGIKWEKHFAFGTAVILEHPLRPRTFMRRVQQVLVSAAANRFEGKIKLQALTINPHSFTVTRAGKVVPLTRQEFRLLYHLASHPNKFCTADRLLGTLWSDRQGFRPYIDALLESLKRKIELDSDGSYHILLVRTRGYCFETLNETAIEYPEPMAPPQD